MLDDDDRGSVVDQMPEHGHQGPHVQRMQAYRRLVKDEEGIPLPAPHLAGKFQALGFSARKAGSRLAQGQIPESEVVKDLQPSLDQ